MKHGYLALLFLLFPALATAQTTLSPGDLVILNVQADNPDQFIFIPLIDLDANTVIYFTDCGVTSNGEFESPNSCGEGALQYTAPAGAFRQGPLSPGSLGPRTSLHTPTPASTPVALCWP